jgi:hypothetical protein
MQDLLNSLVAPDACLTVDQLATGRDVTYRRLCAELAAAYKAGYVTRADRGCYCLTLEGRAAQKTGVMHEAGAARPPPRGGASWKDTDRTRIWAGIRRLGKFCRADVVEVSAKPGQDLDAFETTVKHTLGVLLAAGYLLKLDGRVQVRARGPFGQARYRLIRDTGPLPPQIRRDGKVFDRNLERVVTADDSAA